MASKGKTKPSLTIKKRTLTFTPKGNHFDPHYEKGLAKNTSPKFSRVTGKKIA